MTAPHTIIHRHRFSPAEVADALGIAEDCLSIQISVECGNLLVDIVEPGVAKAEPPPSPQQAQEPEKAAAAGEDALEPEKPKGGPLARRAAMLCSERGFQVFLQVATAEEAKEEVRRRCGVESRAELDHGADAAAKWDEIDHRYRLWLNGYD